MKPVALATVIVLLAGCTQETPLGDGTGGSTGVDDDGLLDGSSGDPDPTSTSPENGCDVFEQDCEGMQKCMPHSGDGDETWNALWCSPLANEPKQLGEPCVAPGGPVAGIDDCDVGLMCWGITNAQTQGVCTSLCEGSVDAGVCPADTVCAVYNGGALPICLPTCDPLGDGCPDGQVCIPQGGSGGRFVCAVDAAPTGGQYGDPCLAFNKCDPGLFCAPAGAVPGCTDAAGCCSRYCDLDDDDPSLTCDDDTQACVPFFEGSPAPGFESVGGCSSA